MRRKWVKKAAVFLSEILCATALLVGISIIKDGMYLLGVPPIDEVRKVTISYPDVTDEVKEITDKEQIELAVKLTGFLKYSLFDSADLSEEPMVTITYFLRNGESVSVAANRETVWWRGRAHGIKDDEIFINLTEGIFFLREVHAAS